MSKNEEFIENLKRGVKGPESSITPREEREFRRLADKSYGITAGQTKLAARQQMQRKAYEKELLESRKLENNPNRMSFIKKLPNEAFFDKVKSTIRADLKENGHNELADQIRRGDSDLKLKNFNDDLKVKIDDEGRATIGVKVQGSNWAMVSFDIDDNMVQAYENNVLQAKSDTGYRRMIEESIKSELRENGVSDVEISDIYSNYTSDYLNNCTETEREKCLENQKRRQELLETKLMRTSLEAKTSDPKNKKPNVMYLDREGVEIAFRYSSDIRKNDAPERESDDEIVM